MTTTAPSPSSTRSNPVLWILVIAIFASVFAIGFFSQEEEFNLGGFADPRGTGEEGLLAYRLLIEETGGTAQLDVELPDETADVAVLATPPFPPLFANEGEEFIESWVPILDWVAEGGTLISSVDVATGPQLTQDLIDTDTVGRGTCTIDEFAGIDELRVLEYSPLEVEAGDRTCFGEEGPVVSIRQIGDGQIVRLSTIAPLLNRALDDADNGAFAARVTGLENEPTVAFLPEAPVLFIPAEGVTRDDVDLQGDGTTNGDQVARDTNGDPIPFNDGDIIPLDDDGNPVGGGTQTLWQLIELRVKVFFVGLIIAGLLLAAAVGRRLGSPVEEELPIEIPSASYVDAVGRLYSRTPESRVRSAEILRNDLRTDLARRVGMSSNATSLELATAVTGAGGRDELIRVLDGPAPTTDEEFVSLARELVNIRERVDGGGVATLAQTEEISFSQKG